MGVLKEICDWIENTTGKLLWISGPAGAGKSAVAQTIAEAYAEKSILAGSFFFFSGASGRNTADRLVVSIAYQLAIRIPHLRIRLGEIVEADPSILHKPLHAQIRTLVIPLFTSIFSDGVDAVDLPVHPHIPSLVIIDGLDECHGDENQRGVVGLISELIKTTALPLRFLLVSRPEPQIEESFDHLTWPFHRISLSRLHHTQEAENDIRSYLRHEFNRIYKSHKLNKELFWPRDDDIRTLVKNAEGMFVYASTIIKYVDDYDFHPVDRLQEIINNSKGSTPFAELDHLYRRILGEHKNTDLLLSVLNVICCNSGWTLIRSDEIEALLQLRKGSLAIVLRRVYSILDINTLSFYHKSFKDFICDQERAQKFFIDIKKGHAFMAQNLLRYISQ